MFVTPGDREGRSRRVIMPKYFFAQDQKASGTNGGSGTANTWVARDLNTVLVNDIPDMTLVSNQLLMPPGRYDIRAVMPTFASFAKSRLRNVTDGVDLINARAIFNYNITSVGNWIDLRGRFTLSDRKAVELQHLVGSSNLGSNAFGRATSASVPEVYAQVLIKKLG